MRVRSDPHKSEINSFLFPLRGICPSLQLDDRRTSCGSWYFPSHDMYARVRGYDWTNPDQVIVLPSTLASWTSLAPMKNIHCYHVLSYVAKGK